MSADLLTRLIEAGTPAALVAEVAMLAAQAATDKQAIEGRRAVDRERQASRRAGAGHATSRDIPDVTDTPPLSPPSPKPPQTPQEPLPPHTPPESTTRARTPFPKPEGVDPQHWRDFLENRQAKRLKNTATAHAKLLRDLAELADDEWPPGRLVEFAAGRGWGAIFDPREKQNGQRHSPQRTQGLSPMLRACAAYASRDDAGFG